MSVHFEYGILTVKVQKLGAKVLGRGPFPHPRNF